MQEFFWPACKFLPDRRTGRGTIGSGAPLEKGVTRSAGGSMHRNRMRHKTEEK